MKKKLWIIPLVSSIFKNYIQDKANTTHDRNVPNVTKGVPQGVIVVVILEQN